MRLLYVLLLLSPAPLLAQTWIAQYHVGQYRHDTIFEFTYVPPDFCGDYTVHFNASGIVPFAQGLTLYLDILQDAWVDGIAQSAGTSLSLGNGISTYDIYFGGSTHLPLQIRAEGTPELEGEIVPCWIDKLHSTLECTDTLTLIWGESFNPCEVALPTGIIETKAVPLTVHAQDGQVIVRSDVSGMLELFDMAGRKLHSSQVVEGMTRIVPISNQGIIIARLSTSTQSFTRKIAN
jgi:hypothetical protein